MGFAIVYCLTCGMEQYRGPLVDRPLIVTRSNVDERVCDSSELIQLL